MTVAPDGEPSAAEIMSKEHLIGQIAVRPVLEEGEQPAPDEKRPEPGTAVSFDEELTAAKLTPEPVKKPVKPPVPRATVPGADATPAAAAPPPRSADALRRRPRPPLRRQPLPPAAAAPATTPPAAAAPATAPPATPPAAAAPPVPKHVRRLYIARGVTGGGRPGPASAPLAIPLVDLPAPPQDAKGRVTERAVVLEWTAADTPTSYNVYRGDDLMQPLNSKPLTAPGFEDTNATLGQEQCYRVRAIALVDGVSLEGEPSAPRCITPRDEFPPAAPTGLAAVPTPGQISLIWDSNPEKDLAGYLVLRGDAPDGPLKAITAAPIARRRIATRP